MKPRTNRLFFFIILIFTTTSLSAQHKTPYVRIAKIIVDSPQLDNYKAALKEGIKTAVRVEPGVLSLSAVYDITHPTHVTVFEIYADKKAYELHIQTPHFKKYKSATQSMVKSLELTDVIPIAMEGKLK